MLGAVLLVDERGRIFLSEAGPNRPGQGLAVSVEDRGRQGGELAPLSIYLTAWRGWKAQCLLHGLPAFRRTTAGCVCGSWPRGLLATVRGLWGDGQLVVVAASAAHAAAWKPQHVSTTEGNSLLQARRRTMCRTEVRGGNSAVARRAETRGSSSVAGNSQCTLNSRERGSTRAGNCDPLTGTTIICPPFPLPSLPCSQCSWHDT